ncbi:MAG: glutamate formimidoyltransferase [Thermoplasmata archaeon]|nr:glutamate formimidoyltransferase [Thermoplasmata archaeon]
MTKYFEAVPNFSEGRDAEKVRRLAAEATGVPGVALLDVESNADHHRSVISLVGEGTPLSEALFRMIRLAANLIDLTTHHGEHPRMGAADVVPFIPLGESTMSEAVALAEALGARVARELFIPVYLYAQAARRPERQDLAKVRRGEFEGIRDSIATDPDRRPDFGEARVHPTAGAVAIGARPVLIAYNAYLATPDVAVAKRIAHAVRGRDGGLPEVKALGFETHGPDRAQVSMNLTDYRQTPIHRALEAVRSEAVKNGTQVEESEIVGLVPEDALLDAAQFYLQLSKFDRGTILERKVRATTGAAPRTPDQSAPSYATGRLADFVCALGARTPTPGGGSAAAAAGAFGVALGEMVVRYAAKPEALPPHLRGALATLESLRGELVTGIDADSAAYEAMRAARKAVKATPDEPNARASLSHSIRTATEVPLGTARAARRAADLLTEVASELPPALASDLTTARALLDAAITGALANATINLPDASSAGLATDAYRAEIAQLGRRTA